jgi:uncharacterized membrane protein
VFALLYVINVIPLYFLHQEALSARPLEIIFWGILVYLAYMRGGLAGRRSLAVLPVVGAIVSFVPGPAWLWLVVVMLNVAGLACGLLLKPQGATRLAPVARSGAP